MEIDLFTFIAQILNFLILVLLLRHFLYKRVVRAMDEREEKIKSRLSEAEEKQKIADQEADTYRQKQEELEEEKKDILKETKQKAEDRKKELLEDARREVDESREKWRESLSRQKESFISGLREKTGRQIYRVVGKVLKDLADQELEDRIMAAFIRRIENLDEDRKKELRSSLEDSSGRITVTSAFEIDSGRRDDLRKAAQQLFGKEVKTEFERDDELVCGLELHARDQVIAWSVGSYLSELEERISREMGESLPAEKREKADKEDEDRQQDEAEESSSRAENDESE